MKQRFELADLKAAAAGRWPEIHAALGVPREYLNPRKHCPCPYCGGKDRYRYTDHQSTGGFICNQCTPQGGSGFDLLMLVFGWDFQTAAHETAVLLGIVAPSPAECGQTAERTPRRPLPAPASETPAKDKQAALLKRWRAAAELAPESPAVLYLQGRGLDLHHAAPGGRFAANGRTAAVPFSDGGSNGRTPATAAAEQTAHNGRIDGFPLRSTLAEYWTGGAGGSVLIGHFPALIAAVTRPNGELMGLHQTYLTMRPHDSGVFPYDSGVWRKLVLLHPQTGEPLPAKKMYARYSGAMKGAAVRFAPPDEQGRLIVAEGIETALAATELFGLPAAAALSAGGLAAFEWPSETQRLFIVADNDPNQTGITAAANLAHRAIQAGLGACIWQPETQGFDALDELNARRAAVYAEQAQPLERT